MTGNANTAAIEQAICDARGVAVTITSRRALTGGDINRVERLETSAGTFVLKMHAHAPRGFFRAEADGLRALRASATLLRIPDVIALGTGTSSAFLILEDLGDGPRAHDFEAVLGHGIAALHETRAPQYGFDHDGFCGLTTQPNAWASGWVEFYATRRLGYQIARAAGAGLLSTADRHHADALLDRISDFLIEPDEGPALVHGDLWSGNVHATTGGTPALIDPAAYFGHREAEFGMTTLFGGFSSRFYDAYTARYPLASGWRERNPLYQLYHLLNHLNLFGGQYHAQVMTIVRRYL